ncbi:nascent polypeptide-associated complex protein [Hyperthermus butylicus]|uniref:Nascent polypeptide-associated complex protein n=1 Tax=Hyperthermus butylicus (strain DSM 5456 / JCM 9403 / PLM1-5) TaxID=415426 RepID=A2BK27_HYPBU|nr:nascent polypeptide-associated complex protein [Hyperthermus butylicus]ABM80338.1 conserved archaeal protein [Hyperthermus butylicus DSM 5456]
MFRLNPADIRRQFKRLGIKADVDVVEAEEVIVRKTDGKTLVLANPQVLLVKMQGGMVMLQAVSNSVEEVEAIGEKAPEISEEDVRLVAEQAGVSLEEARRALEEVGGDIAAAILLLEERKKASGAS